MNRAAADTDVFYAIADPTRRRILDALAEEETAVKELLPLFDMSQPAVSQHLRVLRDVGLVHLRREGRRKLYRLNADAIRPLHEWTSTFKRFWRNQLRRVKERAEGKMNIA